MDPDDMSNGDSEFEESMGDIDAKRNMTYENKPYDEAFELSGESSTVDSPGQRKATKLDNEKYDEALEVSQSLDTRDGMQIPGGSPHSTQQIANRPFDEALDISSQSEQESDGEFSLSAGMKATGYSQFNSQFKDSKAAAKAPESKPTTQATAPTPQPKLQPEIASFMSSVTQSAAAALVKQKTSPSDDDGSDVSDDDDLTPPIEGLYNSRDYTHLNVSNEVRDLFQYIERYQPNDIDLDTPLKCFIPDYIPAIGEMDAFLKMPRPDGQPDYLGLKVLDEPAAIQSDPTVLELHLKAISKKQYGAVAVRSIEDAARNPAQIERWISSINDLHRTKPPPQVHYKHSMPDMDSLMQTWPEEFEEALSNMSLPWGELDLPLPDYVKMICTILDIPVHDDPIESLHVLFSLYMLFRDNQHFTVQQSQPPGQMYDNTYK